MSMVKEWQRVIAILTHPAVLEAAWLSYWSRWDIRWIVASWGLLVGAGGLLYVWLRQRPRDIQFLLGSNRRFLLLWNFLVLGGFWAATAEPLLRLWVSFFLWMSLCGFLFHWWREYSFHVYGWSGLMAFFLGYGRSYPLTLLLLFFVSMGVAVLRYLQGAHQISELLWGAGAGTVFALCFVGIHELSNAAG
ncbi:MAG: hypothetical protein RMJ66_04075 [Bacteroidia bacterium]|nr:hypothetical protein [Bacteroidia bacterium]MDW8134224.1 hypothetical protein [Bacteroidia bacterium]